MKKLIILLVITLTLMLVLTSCVPSKYDKAVDKLSDKGYNVVADKNSVPALIYATTGANPLCCVIAVKDTDSLYAFYFGNKDDAETAYEYVQTWANSKISGVEVYKSDSCLYFGTEQGVKDFK